MTGMDIEKANLASFYEFHRFHERINRSAKVNTIALVLLQQSIENKHLGKEEIKGKIYTSSKLWGGMPDWRYPSKLIEEALSESNCSAVVRIFSAFDLMLDQLQAEIDSYYHIAKTTGLITKNKALLKEATGEGAEEDKLSRLLKRRQITIPDQDILKELYKYYLLIRNCIAHRDGLATIELEDYSNTDHPAKAALDFQKIKGARAAIIVKKFKFSSLIHLSLREALDCSTILREIGLRINNTIIQEIGFDGIVYLVCKFHLFKAQNKSDLGSSKDMYSYFKDKLQRNYHLSVSSETLIKAALNKFLLREDCLQKYSSIKKQ